MKPPHWSTWYPGSESDWQRLPMNAREELAYAAGGCLIAWPSWEIPVNCVHGLCQVRRGEIKPIVLVNRALGYERESGWLRFIKDRRKVALIYRLVRKQCMASKEYDIWKHWAVIVYGGVGA